jgi:hypothetical protein
VKALTRNTLLALPLALVISTALPSHGTPWWDFLDAFTLAFCFTLVGYWVEVWLLKIPGIETGGGQIIRVLGWFAGGLWCYVLGRWALLAYGRDTSELPSLMWGGFFFVAFQLVLHGVLQASGRPNFYSGQLTESETRGVR